MYLAKILIILNFNFSKYPEKQWVTLFRQKEIECRWRYIGLYETEFILGVFNSIEAAREGGKRLYANILMEFLANNVIKDSGCYDPKIDNIESINVDEFIQYIPKGLIAHPKGLAIYEIDNSLDDFDKYHYLRAHAEGYGSTPRDLPLENLQEGFLEYSAFSQHIFNLVSEANRSKDERVYIPLLCRAIEFMAERNISKSVEEIMVLDECIEVVENSELTCKQKENLKNYLNDGKRKSSRKQNLELVRKYSKINFDQMSPVEVFNDSYNLRSQIIHGYRYKISDFPGEKHLSKLVLHLLYEYLREKNSLPE